MKFVRADTLADRWKAGNLVLVALSGQRIVGAIEMRENSHITLLFVEKPFQRKGIARELFRRACAICRKRNPDIRRITVHSSPNAFVAYQKVGFTGIEDEKVKHGIRFIPMELLLAGNAQPVG
jgi:GNAT superfamily N-acetyltransferase